MMTSKQVFEMENQLKDGISVGFFEHGTHEDMDLIFYGAYCAVQMLRNMLEARDREIYREADRIKREVAEMRGEPKSGACLDEVSFSEEDVQAIKGCSVCGVEESVEDSADVLLITFINPLSMKYIRMEVGNHGLIFITEPYFDNK